MGELIVTKSGLKIRMEEPSEVQVKKNNHAWKTSNKRIF